MAVAVDKDADIVRARAVEADKPAEPTKFEQLRARYEWLDHVVRAGARYTERHGDHYAAAITYFSVLALFPLILVSVAALGYVLFVQPDLLDQLKAGISANAPAGLDDLIVPIVDNAIMSRNTIGIIGLLGALYTGIGWMSNLREALSEQWGQPPTAPPIVKKTLFDLLTLVGLGVAMIGSFAITGLVFGFTGTILEFVGLSEQGWAKFLLGLFGILLGLAANWLIFLWVIARLPREHATLRSAAKAAVLGAIGFEVLKQVMTVYLASVTNSPTGQIIGPFIGLMVFAFFTSRFILFVTAWAATSRENEQDEKVEVPGPAVIHSEVTVRSGPAAGTAAGLVGAGAIAGVLGFGLLRGRRRD
ncbi:YhjD/YihY/BrkB family envelope integrity protein [Pseudonocardia abyssalis]|uniref:YhjD/YihY/BrkB family envelope integrity protein n=1 Tax=Pseudonocardia abyssalis TaxID=2792008 RepID=UPI001CF6ABE6|nr:YhjD/YihY/BrkB family envelope integrity protein [Pseudonocardia abyssalis]